MPYCVDTSSWIDAWNRTYPSDIFCKLWSDIAGRFEGGEIICSDIVLQELSRVDDGISKWMKTRKKLCKPITSSIQNEVKKLMAEFPDLVNTLSTRSGGDPFVIATAMEFDATVVTNEAKNRINKIPDVCKKRNIKCINFVEMIREIGLTY